MTEAFALCTSNYSLTQGPLLTYVTGGGSVEGSDVGEGLLERGEAQAGRGDRRALQGEPLAAPEAAPVQWRSLSQRKALIGSFKPRGLRRNTRFFTLAPLLEHGGALGAQTPFPSLRPALGRLCRSSWSCSLSLWSIAGTSPQTLSNPHKLYEALKYSRGAAATFAHGIFPTMRYVFF